MNGPAKKRLTTSAMIASIAGEGQRTRGAPFGSALVELAEQRPDIVGMTAYAPLFSKIGSTQWVPDLIWFTNNVLWNNGTGTGYDLLVGNGTPMVLSNNLVGEMAPLPAGVVNNNLLLGVDPRFTNVVNFYPRADSPLRNSGVNPVGGIGVLDFAGENRVTGPQIDRGAYEFQELFANGFE